VVAVTARGGFIKEEWIVPDKNRKDQSSPVDELVMVNFFVQVPFFWLSMFRTVTVHSPVEAPFTLRSRSQDILFDSRVIGFVQTSSFVSFVKLTFILFLKLFDSIKEF